MPIVAIQFGNSTFSKNLSQQKAQELLTAFLKFYPVPLDENGNATFTDTAWAVERTKRFLKEAYEIGQTQIAQESTPPAVDPVIID